MTKVLIIGAGHAGGSVAALLRQYGFEGEIVLAGAEPAPPYQRPPLSKAWLQGAADLDDLLLRPLSYYSEQNIQLLTGVMATQIDRDAKTVGFADGTLQTYDHLILAMGSVARKLPILGADRSDLIELRTLEDAERLKAVLVPGTRLAVVGGGYVGLEAAASARKLGVEVVLIERMNRVLARVASKPLSAFFTRHHQAHGVTILTDAEVSAFEAGGVRLADGRLIEANGILIGVGALAHDQLAREAGLDCDNGVVVDLEARTSDPAIFAIGDMTQRPMPHSGGRRHRLESVPNALEQAKQVACAITGRVAPAPEVPWFWSDQYDIKLQIAGIAFEADQQIVRGNPDEGRFAVFHLKGDRVLAVEAVSSPADFMGGRLLISKEIPVDPALLADPSISIKMVGRAG